MQNKVHSFLIVHWYPCVHVFLFAPTLLRDLQTFDKLIFDHDFLKIISNAETIN